MIDLKLMNTILTMNIVPTIELPRCTRWNLYSSLSYTDTNTVSYSIQYGDTLFFKKNICGAQWILDIGYDTGMDTWAKMEYSCNLDSSECIS